MHILTSLAQHRLAVLQQFRDRKRGEQGFTLLDLLLGMAIFALIAIVSISAIGNVRKRALEAEGGAPLEDTATPDPVETPAPTATGDGFSFPWGVLMGAIAVIVVIVALGLGLYFLIRHVKTLKVQNAALDARWSTAYSKFDAVRLDWGTLNSDPLAILEHSRLLDVSFPQTSSFMDSFHILQDRMGVHKESRGALTQDEVKEVELMTTEVQRLWTAARVAAERASYTWLPPTQQGHAALAAKMLRLAADEGAGVGERANAAEKAAALLRKIDQFNFPVMTMEAIEGNTRLMIEAPQNAVAI